jgi:hypothetical protein
MIISGINLRTGITPGWVEVVDHTGRMPIGWIADTDLMPLVKWVGIKESAVRWWDVYTITTWVVFNQRWRIKTMLNIEFQI